MQNKEQGLVTAVTEIKKSASPELLEEASQLVSTLKLTDKDIMNYGVGLSKRYTESTLSNETLTSLGEIGDVITEAMKALSAKPEVAKKRGVMGMIGRVTGSVKDQLNDIQSATIPARMQIAKVETKLIEQQKTLLESVKVIDSTIASQLEVHNDLSLLKIHHPLKMLAHF